MIRGKAATEKIRIFVEKAWRAITNSLKNSIPQIIAVAAAFIIGAIVLAVTGHGPLEAYGTMLVGAFGDIYGVEDLENAVQCEVGPRRCGLMSSVL